MRKIKEVLRLRFELRLGQRAIARLVRLARAPFMNTSTGPPLVNSSRQFSQSDVDSNFPGRGSTHDQCVFGS
jgi:hypothetical protein